MINFITITYDKILSEWKDLSTQAIDKALTLRLSSSTTKYLFTIELLFTIFSLIENEN
jgi:hypothetical protein